MYIYYYGHNCYCYSRKNMSFLGLVPIFQTVRSHLSLAGNRDKRGCLDSMRTYLERRKKAFLESQPPQDDLGSVFEYELHRVTFKFLFDFLEREVIDPKSSDSAAHSHSEKKLPEDSNVEHRDDTFDLDDPVDSLSDDKKGVKDLEGEEEMEDETEDDEVQDDKGELLFRHDPVDSLSNDGKGLKSQEGEEKMEDETGDDEVQDNKGDLLSRHLVTDAILLDSTHQPI